MFCKSNLISAGARSSTKAIFASSSKSLPVAALQFRIQIPHFSTSLMSCSFAKLGAMMHCSNAKVRLLLFGSNSSTSL
jgi:hypothetical protein